MIAPRFRTHPQDFKNAIFGEPVMFTAEATGTQPLSYQWEWKPAVESEEGSSKQGRWQSRDVERYPGADSSTLTIPSVQKSNEGSYRCVVRNNAGKKASKPAQLKVGKDPTIIVYRIMCHSHIFLHL